MPRRRTRLRASRPGAWTVSWLLAGVVLLGACGGADGGLTPDGSPTSPGEVVGDETATPRTGSPSPSPSPEPSPSPSPSPEPSPEPSPSPSPEPSPEPSPSPTRDEDCHPSYPDVCIPPPPPDLNCGDISYRDFRVRYDVADPDPHGFDGDNDEVGCES